MKSLHPVYSLVCFFSTALLFISCGKDKFQTAPRLTIASYNTKEVQPGQELDIRFNYTDKEGDVGGGEFTAIIERMNQKPLLPSEDKADTIRNMVPDAPKTPQAELRFQLIYDFLKESTFENDSIRIKFSVVDREGNSSDTLTSDPLVIVL